MPRYTEVNYTIAMENNWKITHCPKGYAFAIKRQDSSVVCQLHNGLTPQDKSLAQLITAAPDLLDAAYAALEVLSNKSIMSEKVKAYRKLKDAIDKATGESNA